MSFNISREDEDGIQRVDLDDLCMPGIQEHDSSLVRQDFFLDQRNHCNVDAGLLRDGMCSACMRILFLFVAVNSE